MDVRFHQESLEESSEQVSEGEAKALEDETVSAVFGVNQNIFGCGLFLEFENGKVEDGCVEEESGQRQGRKDKVEFGHKVVAKEGLKLQSGKEGQPHHVGLEQHENEGPPFSTVSDPEVGLVENGMTFFQSEEQGVQDLGSYVDDQVQDDPIQVDFFR